MIKEYDLPFEEYDQCKICDGYGFVYLMMNDIVELERWAKRLGNDFAHIGCNPCNKCGGSGVVLVRILPKLELEEE